MGVILSGIKRFSWVYRVSRLICMGMLMAAAFLWSAHSVFAQHQCRIELSYKWIGGEEEEQIVRVETISADAADEEVAKQRVSARGAEAEERVMRRCRDRHENLSGCIAEKFASLSSMMGSLSFTARKTLEDAVAQDCQKLQGRCMNFAASKPKCFAETNPSISEGDEKAEQEKESDKSGKKD